MEDLIRFTPISSTRALEVVLNGHTLSDKEYTFLKKSLSDRLPPVLFKKGLTIWISRRQGEESVNIDIFAKKDESLIARSSGGNIFQALNKLQNVLKARYQYKTAA